MDVLKEQKGTQNLFMDNLLECGIHFMRRAQLEDKCEIQKCIFVLSSDIPFKYIVVLKGLIIRIVLHS